MHAIQPASWYWSYDAESDQIDSLLTPKTRLMRLAAYSNGRARRFAALIFRHDGPARSYALDVDAAGLAAKLADPQIRPVAISADGTGPHAKFTVVTETMTDSHGAARGTAHVDLDEAGLRTLADGHHRIVDVAAYTAGSAGAGAGATKFAAIVEPLPAGETGSQLWVGVRERELSTQLLSHPELKLTRIRRYGDHVLAAVAESVETAHWAWYTDLDGDTVARNLERNHAYPIDLDVGTSGDPRFEVVMYRDERDSG